ncbi:MbtH family protein [Shewanella sp. AS16]|uniref:MbtH family protein n=1 Tax=Shewanella sp. AS16 TaxID=2907625 RepID=UPI002DD44FAE|nr:MbtH family protein [Shewanella sp. AS16]
MSDSEIQDSGSPAADLPTRAVATPSVETGKDSSQYLNPFDDPGHLFLVLINEEQQLSLWPEFAAVPAGWRPIFGPQARNLCLEQIESGAFA